MYVARYASGSQPSRVRKAHIIHSLHSLPGIIDIFPRTSSFLFPTSAVQNNYRRKHLIAPPTSPTRPITNQTPQARGLVALEGLSAGSFLGILVRRVFNLCAIKNLA